MVDIATSKSAATAQPRVSINREIVNSETHILTTGQNVTGNVVKTVKVPVGATMLDVKLSAGALAASAMLVTVGDVADPDRYIESSTIAVLGGVTSMDNELGHLYVITGTNDTSIDITIALQGVTPAQGNLRVDVTYTMDP